MTSTVGQWLVAASLELREMQENAVDSGAFPCVGAASSAVMYPYQLFSQAHKARHIGCIRNQAHVPGLLLWGVRCLAQSAARHLCAL